MRRFFRVYKDIFIYYDYQPLLLFWNIADLVNNRVIWSTYGEFADQGAEAAYIQYALYFCVSLGMLFSLNDLKSNIRFVGAYLILYIFSTTRFIVKIFTDPEFAESNEIGRSLVVTGVYFSLWVWLYVKMRVELAHRKTNG
jgi:hypothetical protein